MLLNRNRVCSAISLLIAFSIPGAVAYASGIALKAGESADLGSVYWIYNCKSILTSFGGIEILEGPPGIELTIREEPVIARKQNCPNKIQGGTVVLTAKEVPSRFSGVLKYRVHYKTEDGDRQSFHSQDITLYPK